MKKLLIVVLLLVVAVGALGYWRGWFTVSEQGVQVDPDKFKKDKAAFSKDVATKTKTLKDRFAALRKGSTELTGEAKEKAEKELNDLQTRHDKLEKQLSDLEQAGEDKFGSLKADLSQSLKELDDRIEDLTKKLTKPKE